MSDQLDHPEAAFEASVLRKALGAIRAELDTTRRRDLLGGDRRAERNLREIKLNRIDALESMLDDPYFGRLDLMLAGEQQEATYYVAKHDAEFPGIRIIDWRTPVGGLFYDGGAHVHEYRRPGGKRGTAELLLKRQLVVRAGRLHKIVDLVGHRELPTAENAEEQFLAEQLASRGEMRLQDIVRTIQVEQNALIRAPHNRTLVIQGVAGSGKTSVAYYRLAYLLYPGNSTGVTARETLLLGPSPLFLSYTEELLPDLGERDVTQNTPRDILLAQVYSERGSLRQRRVRFRRMGGKHQFTIIDPALELLASGRLSATKEAELVSLSRIRGDVRMRVLATRILDRTRLEIAERLPATSDEITPHHDALRAVLERQEAPLSRHSLEFLEDIAATALEPSRVFDLLSPVRSAPLGSLRVALFKELAWVPDEGPRNPHKGEVATFLDRHQVRDTEERARLTQRFEAIVDEYVNELVPELDAPSLYYDTLSKPAVLQQIASDLFTPQELQALASRRKPGRDTIYADEVGAIAALHFDLYGYWLANWRAYELVPDNAPPPEPSTLRISHLILDEAQDLSPLEFALFDRLVGSGSMTVLGDISQGVFDYRGITDWQQAMTALGERSTQFEEMHRSYRSTSEIVQFCNELLRVGDGYAAILAKPVDRHGRKPRLVVSSTSEEMFEKITESLDEYRDAGYSNIAVICRSPKQRREVARLLRDKLGAERIHELDASSRDFAGEISVMTAADAKGLEFEVAVVVDANETRYSSESTYARRALYVACTRALHALDVFASGQPTSLLVSAADAAELVGGCRERDAAGRICMRPLDGSGACSEHGSSMPPGPKELDLQNSGLSALDTLHEKAT